MPEKLNQKLVFYENKVKYKRFYKTINHKVKFSFTNKRAAFIDFIYYLQSLIKLCDSE